MVAINKIKELELRAFEELRGESLREGYKFIERLCDEWISGANRFGAPGEALFLALADNRVVGVCGLNRDPYANEPGVGRVRRLYVSRTHRRGGVGGALLEAVVAHARGHFRLLRARTENAGEFYTAHGFRCVTSEPETTQVRELTGVA